MRLSELRVQSFRNLKPFELETDARFVVFHGQNGQGKTNVLEAVWALAALKPLRATRWREVIAWGAESAHAHASVKQGSTTRKLGLSLTSAGRFSKLDSENISDLSSYFDVIRAVSLLPSDAEIVTGSPAERRRWVDRASFTIHATHLDLVHRVSRLLKQKSIVLRDLRSDLRMLEVLNEQLATHATRLSEARARTLAEILPFVRKAHADIAGAHGVLDLSLVSTLDAYCKVPAEQAWMSMFESVLQEEVRRKRTLAGPQFQDVKITLDGHEARTFASRGQVRSIVLSLKLAELMAAKVRGDQPMFLLDDLSTELDARRTANLVSVLADLDMQVWISTTEPRVLLELPHDVAHFHWMEDGRASPARHPSQSG